ncbi:MAG: hypothetical protein ACRC10_10575 [Thermoguttaceae bacterium]
MSIRFIFFDLGQVLIRFSNTRLLEQVGSILQLTPDELRTGLFNPEMFRRVECGLITEDEYYEHVCHTVGFRPDRTRLIEAANDIFWSNDPIFPVLERLSELNFPCGILSNIGYWHWNYVRSKFPAILDAIPTNHVLSCAVGAMKPQTEIFQAAYETASSVLPNITRPEILFLDDLEVNVLAANIFGFDSFVYNFAEHENMLEQLRKRNIDIGNRG